MAETSLASLEDVVALLGRDLTTAEEGRATAVLAKASALFRREAGQTFTPGSSRVRLKVNGGRVYLPERPVVDVTSVTDDDDSAVEFTRRGQWLDTCRRSHEFVTVAYDHGGEVPDLVRWTLAEIAKKILTLAPEAEQGAASVSRTAGPFAENVTYAAWAVGGQTALSPDDAALARTFRPQVPTVWVQPSR